MEYRQGAVKELMKIGTKTKEDGVDMETKNVLLSPIDGRPISQYQVKALIRKLHSAGNGEIKSTLRSMHRLQIGSLSYVGNPSDARIAIISTKYILNPDLQRRQNASGQERIQETIAKLFQNAPKPFGEDQSGSKNKIYCLR